MNREMRRGSRTMPLVVSLAEGLVKAGQPDAACGAVREETCCRRLR
jgi:hypothetical protein